MLTIRLSELLEQEKYLTVVEKWSDKAVRELYKVPYNPPHNLPTKESMDLKNFKVVKKKGFMYSKIRCFHVEGG